MTEETDINNVQPVVNEKTVNDDDSLDSFFKKKDKKGKKKKSKKIDSATTDKDGGKSKKKESDSKKDSENMNDGSTANDQEEWIDYDDESNKDYSDLKIQNMQINDDNIETPTAEAPEYNEAGELIPPKPAEGPWKTVAPKKSEVQPSVSVETLQPDPPKKTGAYRPPQLRGSAGGTNNLVPSALPKRVRSQKMPEITNELDFPSLSNAAKDISPQGFEMVKQGTKSGTWQAQQHQMAKATEIRLENQYAAFSTDN